MQSEGQEQVFTKQTRRGTARERWRLCARQQGNVRKQRKPGCREGVGVAKEAAAKEGRGRARWLAALFEQRTSVLMECRRAAPDECCVYDVKSREV